MKDEKKNKAELLKELTLLRRRLADIEKEEVEGKYSGRPCEIQKSDFDSSSKTSGTDCFWRIRRRRSSLRAIRPFTRC
jgi:hypothetical protein